MKKVFALLLSVLIICLSGCGSNTGSEKKSSENNQNNETAQVGFQLDMTEATFPSMFSEICTNTNSYIGQTIRLDGMFRSEDSHSGNNEPYCYVYRNVLDPSGCCSYPRGLELDFADMSAFADDSWVHVEGKLDCYTLNVDGNDLTFLRIVDSKVTAAQPGTDPLQG